MTYFSWLITNYVVNFENNIVYQEHGYSWLFMLDSSILVNQIASWVANNSNNILYSYSKNVVYLVSNGLWFTSVFLRNHIVVEFLSTQIHISIAIYNRFGSSTLY